MSKTRLSNRLPATAEDSVGPYYPPNFMDADHADLSRVAGTVLAAEGEAIVLEGRILQLGGGLVAPVLLEFWQADAAGRYRVPGATVDPWFEGAARICSPDGRFSLHTVKPGACDGRAPNITLSIYCDGISRVATQIFFADEPANAGDPLLASLPPALRPRLMAQRTEADGAGRYTIDIVMRGDDETPFFDDMAD